MESTSIIVRFRQTGEHFSVPVSPTTTIKDIIKYICEHSIVKEKIDYNDYFLVLMNNEKIMDDDRIFEEIRPHQIENPDYQLRKKAMSQEFLVDTLSKYQGTYPFGTIAESKTLPDNTESSTKAESDENSTPSALEDVVTNQSTAIPPPNTPNQLQHNAVSNLSQSSGLSNSQSKKFCGILDSNEESKPLYTTNLESNMNNPCPMEPQSMQCIQEELKSSKAEASSSAYPSSLSRSEGLAVTYQQIMTKVNEICAETIRDPVMRRDISDKFNEINILLCGAPRVGKSALINAICEKQVARTRSGLGACTRIISPYRIKDTIEIDSETISYRYNFWDTPGIESWTQKDIQKTLSDIKHKPKSDILCMIYCASPSSYANLEELDRLLKECMDQHIFCALVCTNKWSGQDEQLDAVMNNFQQLLERYHTKTREENGVVFFGNVGLCTAVNSETFVINRANITFEQSGIDELILGITESLDDEKLVQWLMLTFQNKRFRENSHIFPKSLKTILHKLSHKK